MLNRVTRVYSGCKVTHFYCHNKEKRNNFMPIRKKRARMPGILALVIFFYFIAAITLR